MIEIGLNVLTLLILLGIALDFKKIHKTHEEIIKKLDKLLRSEVSET